MVTILNRNTTPRGRPRHPEKAGGPDNPSPPKPPWIRVRAATTGAAIREKAETNRVLSDLGLKTVCQEAACPNLSECWSKRHATFMILGETCTRACTFCNVRTGIPGALDTDEPNKVAEAVAALSLSHAVITSVDRDDLADGGAEHFERVITAIRKTSPKTTIEVLTPDFLKKAGALEIVLAAAPDVFNHNLETVPRLYPSIRPGARYYHSLRLLERAKELEPTAITKSGMMVGLGETREEVLQVMDDMRSACVDVLTIGQYLQPTPKHAAVARFWEPAEFEALAAAARAKGFEHVAASPLTRSSYHAGDDLSRIRDERQKVGARN